MPNFKIFFSMLLLLVVVGASAQTKKVGPFSKVIVSPYIQVSLVQGDEESVTINELHVDAGKLHIEADDNTLRIYLEGARDFPGQEKDYSNGYKETHPLYPNTSVVAVVTYKNLKALSFRGEEKQLINSPVNADDFTLHIYGESEVVFEEMNVQNLTTAMYGENTLTIKSGVAKNQKYTCYGDGEINAEAIAGNTSRIVAYGEPEFKLNVSDRIKVTAFGDAQLYYKGNPQIDKGLHFGDMVINKMD